MNCSKSKYRVESMHRIFILKDEFHIPVMKQNYDEAKLFIEFYSIFSSINVSGISRTAWHIIEVAAMIVEIGVYDILIRTQLALLHIIADRVCLSY